MAPKLFAEAELVETPALDPNVIIGRTIETNLAELIGQPDKYYMNLKFKVSNVEGNRAYTEFHGYSCAKEHLFRIVRKRSQKVRAVNEVETKDGWKLQIVSLVILNRNTDAEIKRKVRKIMFSEIEKTAKDMTLSALIKSITSGALQKEVRKKGNRVYPIRFSEIEGIEVMKAGKGA